MKFLLCSLLLINGLYGLGQRKDSLRVYFDAQLQYSNRKNASFAGLAVPRGDHWLLNVFYPDGKIMLSAYYTDRSLDIKDGPFTFFHPGLIAGIKGQYVRGIKEGIWRYWHSNGVLKDSGMVKHNQSAGYWQSWFSNGQPSEAGWYTPAAELSDQAIITRKYDRKNKSLFGADTLVRIRNGAWESWFENGAKKDSGAYRADHRTGFWKSWHPNAEPESAGAYANDLPEGEWHYFRESGLPSTVEQYQNGKLLSMSCFDEAGRPAGNFCSILKPPVPLLDRFTDFNTYALDHMFWPDSLKGQDVNGMVRVQFTITREGKLVNFMVLETPHPLLAEEVKRFLNSIPGWSPAVSHNRIISYTEVLEVPFFR